MIAHSRKVTAGKDPSEQAAGRLYMDLTYEVRPAKVWRKGFTGGNGGVGTIVSSVKKCDTVLALLMGGYWRGDSTLRMLLEAMRLEKTIIPLLEVGSNKQTKEDILKELDSSIETSKRLLPAKAIEPMRMLKEMLTKKVWISFNPSYKIQGATSTERVCASIRTIHALGLWPAEVRNAKLLWQLIVAKNDGSDRARKKVIFLQTKVAGLLGLKPVFPQREQRARNLDAYMSGGISMYQNDNSASRLRI